MKKIIQTAAWMVLCALQLEAQSSSKVFVQHSYSGSNSTLEGDYVTNGVYYCAAAIGDGNATITWQASSNSWVVSGFSGGNEYTTNSVQYPSNSTSYVLLQNGSNVTSSFFGICQISFSGFVAPQITIASTMLTNFWPTNGGRVTFNITGWNNSSTASNILSVSVGTTNMIFQSTPSAGSGNAFSLTGSLDSDGSNFFAASVSYVSGQADTPRQSSFTVLSNLVPVNLLFSITLDATRDTNVMPTAGSIQSRGYIPGIGQAFASLIPPLPSQLPFLTISNQTNFAIAAGLECVDSNYLYISTSGNGWARFPLTNW